MTLFLAVLAYLGTRGKLEATRRAELDLILDVRNELQRALDDERSAYGPLSQSASRPDARSPEVADWAAQLQARIEKFDAGRTPASEIEDLDLRIGRATLDVAQAGSRGHPPCSTVRIPGAPTPVAAIARRRSCAFGRCVSRFDNPAAALAEYRRLALRRPDDLEVAERIAECLHALRQVGQALDAYSDLARGLQGRGERRRKELDPQRAARDLEKAARIRAWLVSQGRPG
jgi:hypothetical protein